jgi:hypothetical protein
MEPFSHLLNLLGTIQDPRRAQGQLYKLSHLRLFAILAVMAGANSYRAIHSFVDVHLDQLKEIFGLRWRRAPAYTSLRLVLQQLDGAELERIFRIHSAVLADQIGCAGVRVVAVDGKTWRGSFDRFTWVAPSRSPPPSFWAISRWARKRMRSRRFSACWPTLAWRTDWLRPMRCLAKKNVRGRL